MNNFLLISLSQITNSACIEKVTGKHFVNTNNYRVEDCSYIGFSENCDKNYFETYQEYVEYWQNKMKKAYEENNRSYMHICPPCFPH